MQRLLPFLLPKPGKKPQRVNNSLLREMWRTASSMELIPAANRTQLGDALMKQGKESGFNDVVLWCLSRLGARQLFYGPRIRCFAGGGDALDRSDTAVAQSGGRAGFAGAAHRRPGAGCFGSNVCGGAGAVDRCGVDCAVRGRDGQG